MTSRLHALDATIATLDRERSDAATRAMRRAELTQPWQLFVRRMRLLTSQSWGPRVEKYLIGFYGWSKVPASLNRGDALLPCGEYQEVKDSMITASNPSVNLVQIRPYQELDGYRIFVVDRDYTVTRFDLTKAQMAAELDRCGSNAHGTQAAADANTNREYAIRFAWDPADTVCARWRASYRAGNSVPLPHQMPRDHYLSAAQLGSAPAIADEEQWDDSSWSPQCQQAA